MPRRVTRFDKIKIRKLRHGRGGRLVADVVVWADDRRIALVADCGSVICWDGDREVSCTGLDYNPVPAVIGLTTSRQGYTPHDWWLGEGDQLVTDSASDSGWRRVPANFARELETGSRKPVRVTQGRLLREALGKVKTGVDGWF